MSGVIFVTPRSLMHLMIPARRLISSSGMSIGTCDSRLHSPLQYLCIVLFGRSEATNSLPQHSQMAIARIGIGYPFLVDSFAVSIIREAESSHDINQGEKSS
jgi:hypothetical protein